jgi:uncharacterized protein YjhX (UPF0386 family)
MNISKAEQRTLHALAQGGHIIVRREELAAPPDAGREPSGSPGLRPAGRRAFALADPSAGSEIARDGSFAKKPKIVAVECYTRDGYLLVDCKLATFKRLRRRGFVISLGGGPYRVTRAGLAAVRAQLDNR